LAGDKASNAVIAIESFSEALKLSAGSPEEIGPNGHFAPLWGVVCLAMGVIFVKRPMFSFEPCESGPQCRCSGLGDGTLSGTSVLASESLQKMIIGRIEREWNTEPEDAGQVVPVLDLWVGRHELLYSRIFNS
jgi:Urease accessory protein UreF